MSTSCSSDNENRTSRDVPTDERVMRRSARGGSTGDQRMRQTRRRSQSPSSGGAQCARYKWCGGCSAGKRQVRSEMFSAQRVEGQCKRTQEP